MMKLTNDVGRWLFVLFFTLALGLAGCPGDENGNGNGNGENGNGNGENGNGNGNGEEDRALAGVIPDSGPIEGGTAVELTGEGFESGLVVLFADAACTGLVVISETKASCYTPARASEGVVDVTAVWPDDHQELLSGAFTYVEEVVQGDPVDYCHLQWPFALFARPGEEEVGPIYGWVHHGGITDGDDNGDLIIAEVGYAPAGTLAGAAGWTWFPSPYHDRRPNDSEELVNYEYRSFIDAPAEVGEYDFAYRFRLADGGPWTWCHSVAAGGSAVEYDPDHAGRLVVEEGEPPPLDPVEYCHLQYPTELFAQPDEVEAGPIFGWVYHPGITDSDGQAQALEAQVGFGAQGSDPGEEDGDQWTWFAGVFNERKANDFGELTNYEYEAFLDAPEVEGTYHFAYRFRIRPDGPWTYCHSAEGDGSDHVDGYSPDFAGVLHVAEAEPARVDYCHLQWPFSLTVEPDAESELVYGRVYHAGITTPPRQDAALIAAQVGFGPEGSDPRVDGVDWTWFDSGYNDRYANDFEYQGSITAPAVEGVYDYAYRFKLVSGGDWLYCHQGGDAAPAEALGSDHVDGYSPDYAGKMTVEQ